MPRSIDELITEKRQREQAAQARPDKRGRAQGLVARIQRRALQNAKRELGLGGAKGGALGGNRI